VTPIRPDFADSLVLLMAQEPNEPASHPDTERWLAYRRGELPEEEVDDLHEHLAGCLECSELILAADAFAESPEEEDAETAPPAQEAWAAAAAWRLLAPQLDGLDAGGGSRVPADGRQASRPAPPHWRRAVAASLTAAVVGLGAWSIHQQRRLAELTRPQANPHSVYLAPQERAEPQRLVTEAGEPLMLILYPEAPSAGESYQVELIELSGARERTLESMAGLVPDEDSALSLYLPAGLPAGRYRVDLTKAAGRSPPGADPSDGDPSASVTSHRLDVLENSGSTSPKGP
jgi:hypothetical protein